MNMKRINMTAGQTYQNKNGEVYRCLEEQKRGYVVRCVTSGWTCTVHGVWQYENGDIEWDYSTGGYFAEE